MNPRTVREEIGGPSGRIEIALDRPEGTPRGVAVVCHPHPQGGGTLDNNVVFRTARGLQNAGLAVVRFNFRGVGRSEGEWGEGPGEIEDALAVVAAVRKRSEFAGLPWALAGFSFGAWVAATVADELPEAEKPRRLVMVGPSTEKQSVPRVPADTVVVHGEVDELVPLSATLDWARPQTLPVIVLPGVGHFFHGQLTTLKNVLVRELHELAAV